MKKEETKNAGLPENAFRPLKEGEKYRSEERRVGKEC